MLFLKIASTYAILAAAAVNAAGVLGPDSLFERALNGKCTGKGNAPGVCIKTTDCSSGGGSTIDGACPDDPENVKCCTKTTCGDGGNCRWTSQCSGTTQSNLCPGPADFKCCLPGGSGSYPDPKIPSVGSCKATAVAGAKAIVNHFPGKVREIGCIRDCSCPGTSDHCCGMATDMMCSDKAGVKTSAGEPIAEWVMNNHKPLKVKYVIWGQRIWETDSDAVKDWAKWTKMEDRGDNTANHWDHVHVSYA